MAIPPEPIEEVLPEAAWVVDAEVKEVVSVGPRPPTIEAKPGATSVGQKTASQVVRLTVKRVLRGTDVKELTVEKPEAGYALRAGNHGPFVIKDAKPHPVILGRYGPDSWSWGKIEAALSQKRR
ncbi:MAG: hypothetical protein IRZ16_15965 [Myxococcaceae bacterium]|nr:hypothetical protein [Myxococcaceae bacterium]